MLSSMSWRHQSQSIKLFATRNLFWHSSIKPLSISLNCSVEERGWMGLPFPIRETCIGSLLCKGKRWLSSIRKQKLHLLSGKSHGIIPNTRQTWVQIAGINRTAPTRSDRWISSCWCLGWEKRERVSEVCGLGRRWEFLFCFGLGVKVCRTDIFI